MSVSQRILRQLQSSKEPQMKRMILTSTVVALGLAISGTALAGNKGSGSGPGKGSSMKGGATTRIAQNQGRLHNGGNQTLGSNSGVAKKVGGNQQTNNVSGSQSQSNKKGGDSGNKGSKSNGSNGSSNHKMDYKIKEHVEFKDFHGHCYHGREFRFWSNYCFDARYGCEIYYCPIRTCWYFWFEPWDCYLPCDYWAKVCYL